MSVLIVGIIAQWTIVQFSVHSDSSFRFVKLFDGPRGIAS